MDAFVECRSRRMMTMMIDFDDVLDVLICTDVLKGREILTPERMHHGPCCVCTKCGQYYDYCVCDHNEILGKLMELVKDE